MTLRDLLKFHDRRNHVNIKTMLTRSSTGSWRRFKRLNRMASRKFYREYTGERTNYQSSPGKWPL